MSDSTSSQRIAPEGVLSLNDSNHVEKGAPQTDEIHTDTMQKKTLSFYLAFLSLILGVFVVSLDATSLSVAIPVVTHALNGTTLEAFWANLSLLVAVVVTQPIYTNVSDALGRKIPLYSAFTLFFIGSIVFAVANSMGVLILGRTLQGLGGGGLDVLSEVILADITSLKERPLYLGLLALPMAGGGICGPVIGAAFSQYSSWRWLGWVNLPFLALGFVLAFFFLQLRPIQQAFRQKLKKLDVIGMALLAVGCTTFSLALSWAGPMYPWSSWKTILPLLVGSILLILLGFYESKPVLPMFPYRIFQNTTALMTLINSFIHGVLMYSVMLYAPLFYQAVRLETPFRSAVSVLPISSSIVVFSIVSAVAVEMVRRYRWGIIVSWMFAAAGLGLWALWDANSSGALMYGLQIVAGIGIGTLFSILVIPMQASVEFVDDSGLAAGILVSFRLFGGLVGLSLCSTVFSNTFQHRIGTLSSLPPSLETLYNVREIVAFIPMLKHLQLEPVMMTAVSEAYRLSIMAVFLMLAGFGVVGFVTSFFIKDLTLEKEELGRQRFEGSS